VKKAPLHKRTCHHIEATTKQNGANGIKHAMNSIEIFKYLSFSDASSGSGKWRQFGI